MHSVAFGIAPTSDGGNRENRKGASAARGRTPGDLEHPELGLRKRGPAAGKAEESDYFVLHRLAVAGIASSPRRACHRSAMTEAIEITPTQRKAERRSDTPLVRAECVEVLLDGGDSIPSIFDSPAHLQDPLFSAGVLRHTGAVPG